jgi:hypothetical protein
MSLGRVLLCRRLTTLRGVYSCTPSNSDLTLTEKGSAREQ